MIPVVVNNVCSQDLVYESESTRDNYGLVERKQDALVTNAMVEDINVEAEHAVRTKGKVLLKETIFKKPSEDFYSGKQWEHAGKYASSFFSQWLDSWRSMNVEYFLSHYSESFSTDGYDYDSWVARKRKISKVKTYISVQATNVKLLEHPEKDIMAVTFLQDYKSNNYSDESWKRQYWIKEADERWRIVYESTIEGPFEPFLDRYNK